MAQERIYKSNKTKHEDLLQDAVKAFVDLKSVAGQLNFHSEEFSESIKVLEEHLKKLNIGVSAWVSFKSNISPLIKNLRDYRTSDLGYSKIDGHWGLSIRLTSGYAESFKEYDKWQFTNAPRRYRLEAIVKLPELLAALKANTLSTCQLTQLRTAWLNRITEELKRETYINGTNTSEPTGDTTEHIGSDSPDQGTTPSV